MFYLLNFEALHCFASRLLSLTDRLRGMSNVVFALRERENLGSSRDIFRGQNSLLCCYPKFFFRSSMSEV